MRPGGGLDELFSAFGVLGGLQRAFEASETKHRLRRAGFDSIPAELREPFVTNAFFGDVVLTSSALSDVTAGEARCTFYSGVVVRTLSECVATRLAGRPEMQVGLAFSVKSETWGDDDDRELEALRCVLGPAWSIDRWAAGRRKALCLAAREDALHLIDRLEDNRLGLLRVRDDFFPMRWADLADAPAHAYEWLKRKA